MGMARRVNTEPREIGSDGHPALPNRELGFGLPRGSEGEHRGDRCRVIEKAEPATGKSEHLPQPIGGDLLELSRRGRGTPQHRLDVERGDEHLADDPRNRRRRREVAEEAGMIPMRDAWYDPRLEISQNV